MESDWPLEGAARPAGACLPVVPDVKMKRKFDMMSTLGRSLRVSSDVWSSLSNKLMICSEGDV